MTPERRGLTEFLDPLGANVEVRLSNGEKYLFSNKNKGVALSGVALSGFASLARHRPNFNDEDLMTLVEGFSRSSLFVPTKNPLTYSYDFVLTSRGSVPIFAYNHIRDDYFLNQIDPTFKTLKSKGWKVRPYRNIRNAEKANSLEDHRYSRAKFLLNLVRIEEDKTLITPASVSCV